MVYVDYFYQLLIIVDKMFCSLLLAFICLWLLGVVLCLCYFCTYKMRMCCGGCCEKICFVFRNIQRCVIFA